MPERGKECEGVADCLADRGYEDSRPCVWSGKPRMVEDPMVLRLLWFAIEFMLFLVTPVGYLLAFLALFRRRPWLLVLPVINGVVVLSAGVLFSLGFMHSLGASCTALAVGFLVFA